MCGVATPGWALPHPLLSSQGTTPPRVTEGDRDGWQVSNCSNLVPLCSPFPPLWLQKAPPPARPSSPFSLFPPPISLERSRAPDIFRGGDGGGGGCVFMPICSKHAKGCVANMADPGVCDVFLLPMENRKVITGHGHGQSSRGARRRPGVRHGASPPEATGRANTRPLRPRTPRGRATPSPPSPPPPSPHASFPVSLARAVPVPPSPAAAQ